MELLLQKYRAGKAINHFHKKSSNVPLSPKYTSVAGLSATKDIFLGIFWNFQNILSVQQLWTTLLKLLNDFV